MLRELGPTPGWIQTLTPEAVEKINGKFRTFIDEGYQVVAMRPIEIFLIRKKEILDKVQEATALQLIRLYESIDMEHGRVNQYIYATGAFGVRRSWNESPQVMPDDLVFDKNGVTVFAKKIAL